MTDQVFGNILWNVLVTVAKFVSSLWSKAHRELQQFCVVFMMNSNLVGIQSEKRERLEDEGTTLKWKKNRFNL